MKTITEELFPTPFWKKCLERQRLNIYKDRVNELGMLRNFRDDVLNKSKIGRISVKYYYKISPPIADYIHNAKLIRYGIKMLFIDRCVTLISKRNKLLVSLFCYKLDIRRYFNGYLEQNRNNDNK